MSLQRLGRIAFFLALLAVIAGSLVPFDLIDLEGRDKSIHLVGYFALALLAAIGWPRWRGWALVGLPLFGLALEVAQGATGRTFDWGDALANAAGIGIAVAGSAAFTRWMTR